MRVGLWRLSGPAISFAGQWYAVHANIDLEHQRKVFFVLAAQSLISAADYPYFIAARKRPRTQVPLLYAPAWLGFFIVGFLVGWIDSTLKLLYCGALLMTITVFARVYRSELEGTVTLTMALGTLRNTTVTTLLLLYITGQEIALGFIALAFSSLSIINKSWAFRGGAHRVILEEKFSWREVGYYLIAAGMTSVFFLFDRQVIIHFHPDRTQLVNQVFILTSVVLLLSNIWAVNRSRDIGVVSHGGSRVTLWFSSGVALLGGAILFATGLNSALIVLCLLASPIVFSMYAPRLLAIQEQISARTTVLGYGIIFLLKALCLWGVDVTGVRFAVYLIPLLGVACPALILALSFSRRL